MFQCVYQLYLGFYLYNSALNVYFRNKPIAPYCDYFDRQKIVCSLEGQSLQVCYLKKFPQKLPREYQVRESKSERRKMVMGL